MIDIQVVERYLCGRNGRRSNEIILVKRNVRCNASSEASKIVKIFMKANELEMMIVNGELKNCEIIKRMK